jgi:type I restriction enzyme S subunit
MVPFGRVVQRRKESGRPDLQPLSVFLDAGVVPRSERDDNRNELGADLGNYLIVEPGDIVFNKLRTWQGGLGVSRHHGIVSPAYFVCRPSREMEPRFLHYLLRSAPYLAELTRVSKFMPPSQFDILWDDLRLVPIPILPLARQRAITDYLDAETASIEAVLEKKRHLAGLIDTWFWVAVANDLAQQPDVPMVPLRRVLTKITDGPFGSSLTSAHYVDEGARVVRLSNIGFAEFKDDDRAFISWDHYAAQSSHRVGAGDLLIAGLGDSRNHAGRACVAPDLGPAIVKADCYCASVDRRRALPAFLALFLSSPPGAEETAVASRGTTRSRINLDIARDVRVPLPSLEVQRRVLAEATRRRRAADAARQRLERQIVLLTERRQAVVTQAIAGELDVRQGRSFVE